MRKKEEGSLSYVDRAILKVLMDTNDGKRSSMLFDKETWRTSHHHRTKTQTHGKRLFGYFILFESEKFWMATCGFVNLYSKWKD